MRSTRRLLELRSSRLLALVACLALPGIAVSCSSADDDGPPPGDTDASADASEDHANADAGDGDGDGDGGKKDVAVVDASPLPIRCETPPCAVMLTTTLQGDFREDEGYCALLSDGTVACWGANTAGQLGTGETRGATSAVGVRVPGLSGITSIDHTCAIDGSGAVWCWGRGPFQNDASASVVVGSPVRIDLPGPADAVAMADATACALLRDQHLYCWGAGYRPPANVDIPAGVKSIAIGTAAFAIYEDGTMMSWGNNPGVGRATPLQNDTWPTPVALERVAMVDTIGPEACAVANGVGWCWGKAPKPAAGRLEDPLRRALPAAVDVPEPLTRIATSQTSQVAEYYSGIEDRPRWCASSVSGEVYCWGLNASGQAGDGTKKHAVATVRVVGLPAPAAEIKIMPYSSCSILTNGKVYCWGSNNFGQIGGGLTKGAVLTPTEVKLP